MRVILASSNKGKIKEIQAILGVETIPYQEILGDIEIEESGKSFKENAIIKAKSIFEKLPNEIVIADDSGLSVLALNNEPGIFSARYAGKNATDKENLEKLVLKLKEKGVNSSKAFYTAAIAIASPSGIFTTHGWMWGKVVTTPKGDNGFGYDPIFIPEGFDKTLGELDSSVKEQISHRKKALELAKILLERV
ncbi:MAG: RdgB/HAM1 family non-canonical purine NTP pyrophosphatase [Epsilonproteobacteria bacterium]|nr:RdgB/HAM1 family non-canonical purine NTP pyrophosphatase [Campylobacterota bacterium]